MEFTQANIIASLKAQKEQAPSEPTLELLEYLENNQMDVTPEQAIAELVNVKSDCKFELKQVRGRERELVKAIGFCDHLLGTTPKKRVRRVSSTEAALANQIRFLENQLQLNGKIESVTEEAGH